MYGAALLRLNKIPKQFVVETSKQTSLANKLSYASAYFQKDAGFSLIELTVVLLMLGILAAIAAPGWVAFVNRQRVNKVNDAVFAALQEAQREAKKKKLSYSVSFKVEDNLPKFLIHQGSVPPSSGSQVPYSSRFCSTKFGCCMEVFRRGYGI